MTRRKEIIKLLKNNPMSITDLSVFFGDKVSNKDIAIDLEHIRKTIKKEGERILQQPARCQDCGFMFTDRDSFTKPSKCPECKNEWIAEAIYKIE